MSDVKKGFLAAGVITLTLFTGYFSGKFFKEYQNKRAENALLSYSSFVEQYERRKVYEDLKSRITGDGYWDSLYARECLDEVSDEKLEEIVRIKLDELENCTEQRWIEHTEEIISYAVSRDISDDLLFEIYETSGYQDIRSRAISKIKDRGLVEIALKE